MRYVFGPIASRRLGRSLGVDPIAFKTCNWNCVYCQLGRSTPLHTERAEWVPAGDVVAEVREALSRMEPDAIDWITFGGSGEPTLHASLGQMIREVKRLTAVPVAVLTNGSLLVLPEVREDLMAADAVLPTLDAGSPSVFQRLNRPHPDLTFEQHVRGLEAFRAAYPGKLWVEVMLVRGVNDTDKAMADLARVLDRVRPDDVHVTRPVRPPAEGWVEPPSDEAVARFAAALGRRAHVVPRQAPVTDLSEHGDIHEAVLAILKRHPMSVGDLRDALSRWDPRQVDAALAHLRETEAVRQIQRLGQTFWAAAEARYGWPPPARPEGGDRSE